MSLLLNTVLNLNRDRYMKITSARVAPSIQKRTCEITSLQALDLFMYPNKDLKHVTSRRHTGS